MKARMAALVLVLASLLVSGMAAQKDNSKVGGSSLTAASQPSPEQDGEKLFRAHCGRCHGAPEELSPRVARTVLKHMRVRAMLSSQDEQAILSYIAPE